MLIHYEEVEMQSRSGHACVSVRSIYRAAEVEGYSTLGTVRARLTMRQLALLLTYLSAIGIVLSSISCIASEPTETPDSGTNSVEFPLTATLNVVTMRPNVPDVPESRYSYVILDRENYQVVSQIGISSGIAREVYTSTRSGHYFSVTERSGVLDPVQERELIEIVPPIEVRKFLDLTYLVEGYGELVGDGIPTVSHATVMDLIDAGLVITGGMSTIAGIPAQEYETVPAGDDPFFGAIRFKIRLDPVSGLRLGGNMSHDGDYEYELRMSDIVTDTTVTVSDLYHPPEDNVVSDIRVALLESILQEQSDPLMSEVLTTTASVVSSTWLVGSSIVVTGTSEIPEGDSHTHAALERVALSPTRSSWLVVNELVSGQDTILVFQGDDNSALPIVPVDSYWPPHWSTVYGGHSGMLTDTRAVTLTGAVSGTQYSQVLPTDVMLPFPLPPFINLLTWVEDGVRLAAVSSSVLDEVVLDVVRAWRAEAGE